MTREHKRVINAETIGILPTVQLIHTLPFTRTNPLKNVALKPPK